MLKIGESFSCSSVWAVMKADLFFLLVDILCCAASEVTSLFSCLLPLSAFPWCMVAKTAVRYFPMGRMGRMGGGGLLKDEDNL